MLRLNLRRKLTLFSAVIAIIPLLIAGQSLIRIAQDELKSSANDQLVTTARQVTDQINSVYEHAWLAPLLLIRNAIDEERLGVQEKVSLLTLGIGELQDVVALQITLKGADRPLVVSQQSFVDHLRNKVQDPMDVLRLPTDFVEASASADGKPTASVQFVPKTGDWLATVILPLETQLANRDSILSARLNLNRLITFIRDHRFQRTGEITVVDADGRKILHDNSRPDLSGVNIVADALKVLTSGSRVISVRPYTRPDGAVMLGAFSFPRPFKWGVVVEKNEADAYYAVSVMFRSLLFWVGIGLAAAAAGALFFAMRMSKPILAIGDAAIEVARGNFQARVENVRSRDEIGDLAGRINEMIVQLNERFQLQKFVSSETMSAIQHSGEEGVKLGGERREVAILFADIRGYTEFSDGRDPEEVVDVLNHYFQSQADIVAANKGDIDKFVGDQLMAIFAEGDMAMNAVKCSLAIQDVMVELSKENPEWNLDIGIGVDMGEVVVGAMGSRNRMDYTVLGDHVNVAARLCSNAAPKQTLISETVHAAVKGAKTLTIKALDPIKVKGKAKALKVYDVKPKATPKRRTAATAKKAPARSSRRKSPATQKT